MKKRSRIRAILCLAAFLLPLLLLPVSAATAAPELPSVGAAYLYNITFDTVMCEKNAQMPVSPASTVKIMTGLLATELLADRLEESVKVTSVMLAGAPQSKIKVGNTLTVRQMLTSLLREKNNDAAYVLAYLAAGSATTFVRKMNDRAAELGMTQTRFVNPTGLDETGAVTTAHDVALLALAANENEVMRPLCRSKNYSIAGGTCYVLNAGMTDLGGYCQVVLAEMSVSDTVQICVTLGGKTEEDSQSTVTQLLRWGVNHYDLMELVRAGQAFREIPVTETSSAETVKAVAEVGLTRYLPTDVTVGDAPTCDVFLDARLSNATLEAPVQKGEKVGFIAVYYNGEQIGTVALVAGQTVEANSLVSSLSSLTHLMSSRAFIAALICAVILFGVYFFVEYRRYRARKQLLRRYRAEHRHLYR